MIANRRALASFLLAGGVCFLAPRASPRGAAEQRGGRPAPVRFDSITVTDAHFSPNHDGARDKVVFGFTLAEPLRVTVFVAAAGTSDTVRVLGARDSLLSARAYQKTWTGFSAGPDSVLQPEGTYDVVFVGNTPTGQPKLRNQRQVQLDLTPPQVEILEVNPRQFTPTLPGNASVVPKIRVRVTQSEIDDAIGVVVLDPRPRGVPPDTLPPAGGFAGDGDYLMLCSVCTGSTYTDGRYTLRAFGADAAGNVTTATDSLDKNTKGPAIEITHPLRPRAVQFADSLTGRAQDRQVVDSLRVQLGPPADTTLVLVPGIATTTFRFAADVTQILAAEAIYPLTLRSYDADGVQDSLKTSIRVDRTRPLPPVLSPPPPAVTKEQTLSGTALVDTSEVIAVVVAGGAEPPDTLVVTDPRRGFTRELLPGSNSLRFESIDRAHNISPAATAAVVWETSRGLVAPERFRAGQEIQVDAGDSPAESVEIRILALDGSPVRTFADRSSKLVYSFPWDLTTPEGRVVKNGAYLVSARVLYPGGAESRYRQMIAVVE